MSRLGAASPWLRSLALVALRAAGRGHLLPLSRHHRLHLRHRRRGPEHPGRLCGQFSLGHAALMAMGAYTTAHPEQGAGTNAVLRRRPGRISGSASCRHRVAAGFGALLAFPALRVRGPYPPW